MAHGNLLCKTNVALQGWGASQTPCGAAGGVLPVHQQLPSGSDAAIAMQISAVTADFCCFLPSRHWDSCCPKWEDMGR